MKEGEKQTLLPSTKPTAARNVVEIDQSFGALSPRAGRNTPVYGKVVYALYAAVILTILLLWIFVPRVHHVNPSPPVAPSPLPPIHPIGLETTIFPTTAPTMVPTTAPTTVSTAIPTVMPSINQVVNTAPVVSVSTSEPFSAPTSHPSSKPSSHTSSKHTKTHLPTVASTDSPTLFPTFSPTKHSKAPSAQPTELPTVAHTSIEIKPFTWCVSDLLIIQYFNGAIQIGGADEKGVVHTSKKACGSTPQGWTTLTTVDKNVYSKVAVSYGIAGGVFCNSYIGCTCTYKVSDLDFDKKPSRCENCELACGLYIGKPMVFATVHMYGEGFDDTEDGLQAIEYDGQTENSVIMSIFSFVAFIVLSITIYLALKRCVKKIPTAHSVSAMFAGPKSYQVIPEEVN